MSIDGTWTINTINKRIRIDKGRAYAIDGWVHLFTLKIEPGMVVIKNIAQSAPGIYVGDDLPLMGKWQARFEADKSLSIKVAGSMGPINYKLIPVQVDSPDWIYKEMIVAGLRPDPSKIHPPVEVPTPPSTNPEIPVSKPPPPPMFIQPGPPPPPAYNPPAPPPPPAYKPPPVFKKRIVKAGCGGDGQAPCGKKAKIDAVKVGNAKKWGCKGKNNYFTPHNGGECWACPSGFKRTTTPIHKSNSCKTRGFKIGKKDRENAKFVSAAFSCPKGQFRKNSTCYACPKGSKKVGISGVFNPTASCKTEPYCKSGMKLTPIPPKSLMEIGPYFQRKCSKPFKARKVLLPMAKHHMGLSSGISVAAGKFAFDVLKDKALRKAIKNKNGRAITASIKRMTSFNKLKSSAQAKGYRSVSIGVGSGVKAGLGLEQEVGVALDWNANVGFYATTIVSKGLALSAGSGISLGVWTIDKDQLGGYAHGVSTSLPAGVVDIGGGAWFSYYPIDFLGLAYTAGMGVGMEIGVYNEAITLLSN
ncbi:MAG: hypothetical protein ACQ9MH_10425 [Nitrospinales bacterium]